jgi:hypothetical protein
LETEREDLNKKGKCPPYREAEDALRILLKCSKKKNRRKQVLDALLWITFVEYYLYFTLLNKIPVSGNFTADFSVLKLWKPEKYFCHLNYYLAGISVD